MAKFVCVTPCWFNKVFWVKGREMECDDALIMKVPRHFERTDGKDPRVFDPKTHKLIPQPVEPEPTEEEAEGDFVCDVCGKSCKSPLGLSSHKRSHAE